jgi:transposase-like protein
MRAGLGGRVSKVVRSNKIMETQRLPNESTKAYAAYECYRELGAGRSIEKVAEKYSKSVGLLYRWSSQHQWVNRAAEWDKEQERLREEARQVEIEKIMSSGYAATHNRVKHLNKLAKRQWKDMQNRELVWLPDVKQIGGGEFAERVDIIRYNAGLDEQFRKTLEDISAEVGGRVKRSEVEVKGNLLAEYTNINEIDV